MEIVFIVSPLISVCFWDCETLEMLPHVILIEQFCYLSSKMCLSIILPRQVACESSATMKSHRQLLYEAQQDVERGRAYLQMLDHQEIFMSVDKQIAKLFVLNPISTNKLAKLTWNVWLMTLTFCQIAGTADGDGYIRVGHLCWIDLCSATQAPVSIAFANLYFSILGGHGLDLHLPRIEGNTPTYFK